MTKMLLPFLNITIIIISFLSKDLQIALRTLQVENFKKHLMSKKILSTTRQPKTNKLRNMRVRGKFETKAIPK